MAKIRFGILEVRMEHRKCGGEVSISRLKCLKCGKHFYSPLALINPFYFAFPRYVNFPEPTRKTLASYKGIQPIGLAKYLPNWPRWARILSFSIVMAISIGLIFLFVIR